MSTEIFPGPLPPSDDGPGFHPEYALSDSDLNALEKRMSEYTQDHQAAPGIHALLIEPTHPFSNFVRTHEGRTFPGADEELSIEAELQTKQFALVDTRVKSKTYGKTAFVSTISGFRSQQQVGVNKTGIVAVDELIDIPENSLSAADFDEYCVKNGVDPQRILGVETTVKLQRGVERYHGLRVAQLGYLTVFSVAKSLPFSTPSHKLGFGAIGRVNHATVTSTGRTSIKSVPLMDRVDWATPEDQAKEDYYPVLYKSRDNRVLSLMRCLAPKIITVDAE